MRRLPVALAALAIAITTPVDAQDAMYGQPDCKDPRNYAATACVFNRKLMERAAFADTVPVVPK